MARLYVKKTHLLILKHQHEKEDPAGLLGRYDDWWAPSSCSPSALLDSVGAIFSFHFFFVYGEDHLYAPTDRHHFMALPLLKQVCAIFLFCFVSLSLFLFLFSASAIFALYLTSASGHHLHPLPLRHSRAPVCPRGELLDTSGALGFTFGDLVFAAATRGDAL